MLTNIYSWYNNSTLTYCFEIAYIFPTFLHEGSVRNVLLDVYQSSSKYQLRWYDYSYIEILVWKTLLQIFAESAQGL